MNMFPEDDMFFEMVEIESVSTDTEIENGIEIITGWSLLRKDGWSMYVSIDVFPEESTFEPKAGMIGRFYGKGIGYPVRGIFLDKKKVYYRTEEQEAEKRDIDTYGADIKDWLQRWDDNKTVWSVSMGGLGPGYEQAIQITVAELVRIHIEKNFDIARWEDNALWKKDVEIVEAAAFKVAKIDALGLSGSQFGAAMQVATRLYKFGPRQCLKDEKIKDRLILIQKHFPS